jgi:hypothetical protein
MDFRLRQMQSEAESIVTEWGFDLLSPFADRHGVAELRFVQTSEETVQWISMACDTTSSSTWRCQIMAGASLLEFSEWREVATFKVRPGNGSREVLAIHFLASAVLAAELAALLKAKTSRPALSETATTSHYFSKSA